MTARRLLTKTERQLLEAVRQIIDIPAAATYEDLEGRAAAVMERAAYLVGCLTDLDKSFASAIVFTLTHCSDRPLGYTPVDRPVTNSLPSGDLTSHG